MDETRERWQRCMEAQEIADEYRHTLLRSARHLFLVGMAGVLLIVIFYLSAVRTHSTAPEPSLLHQLQARGFFGH